MIVKSLKKKEFYGASFHNIYKFFNFIFEAYNFWTLWISINLVIYLYYFSPIEIRSWIRSRFKIRDWLC
jgi:hypothetical protein